MRTYEVNPERGCGRAYDRAAAEAERDSVERTVLESIPHGSGIDGDWVTTWEGQKLSLSNVYRRMDGSGFYVSLAHFTVTLAFWPDWSVDDWDLSIDSFEEFEADGGVESERSFLEDLFADWLDGRAF